MKQHHQKTAATAYLPSREVLFTQLTKAFYVNSQADFVPIHRKFDISGEYIEVGRHAGKN